MAAFGRVGRAVVMGGRIAQPVVLSACAAEGFATSRARLSQQLDGGGAAALTREERAALAKQREAASEEGVLRELLHEAVHTRNAKDNVTVVMVRFA